MDPGKKVSTSLRYSILNECNNSPYPSSTGSSTTGYLLVDLHKRQMSEREFLLSALKGAEAKALTSIEMITEYVLIASQQITVNIEKLQFEYCAMATGLAERPQEFKSER